MSFIKSALLGSAAVIAVVATAQAADLPSKKAAPATYVKICDAYGAGFFFIPGTDTCVKVGGYVRYEAQYTPGQDIRKAAAVADSYAVTGITGNAVTTKSVAGTASGAITQSKQTQDTFGAEYRGRIDLDARTPTGYGVARSFVSLRGTGTTGLRKSAYDYNAATAAPTLTSTNPDLVMERAFIQWAGFTVGIAGSNYAMMPSLTYTANGWAGFPNGQRQVAYTAVLGGGFSATVALEDKQMWGNDQTDVNRIDTTNALVGNIRLDQAWGFAAIHGVVGKHSLTNGAAAASSTSPQLTYAASTALTGTSNADPASKTGYGIGATVGFNLDMITKGDKIWLTSNYENGWYGAVASSGSLTSLSDGSSGGRTLGGVIRKDANVVWLGNTTVNTATVNNGFDTTTGWNVGGQYLHNWSSNLRSMFTAAYVQLTPPTQAQTTALAWGKGSIMETRASLIYSPVKDMDIGVEVQYLRNHNELQNVPAATSTSATDWQKAGFPGLNNSNYTTKLRVERSF